MASSLSIKCYLFLAILLFVMYKSAIAQTGYSEKEKEALDALKATFNIPFLNDNWTGIPCFLSETSKWYGIQCGSNGRIAGIVLESLGLIGNLKVDAFIDFTEMSVLRLKNNYIWGNMMNFSFNQKLAHIDISRNMLSGPISSSVLSLGILESLFVQDNELSGRIPELNQSTLKALNVSNNKLYGPIPTTQALQALGSNSYSGNIGLCGPPSIIPCDITPTDSPHSDSENKNGSSDSDKKDSNTCSQCAMFYILIAVCLVIALFLSVLYYMKYRKPKKVMKEVKTTSTKPLNEESKDGEKKVEEGQAVSSVGGQQEKGKLTFIGVGEGATAEFELGDLLRASAEGLGRGIFGNSYKAKMSGKQDVVVKRIRDLKPLVNEEFNKQLQLIANLKHPNLLPLLAYYHSRDEKLLIYRYVRNGNLFKRLFGEFLPSFRFIFFRCKVTRQSNAS